MTNNTFRAWAPWHPAKGFDKHHYEGPFAYADLCKPLRNNVADLNDLDGTTSKNGWRGVPVAVMPEAAAKALVKALNDLHVWCEIEGCGDQAELIKDAFKAAGVTEYRCSGCDGAGEWDEGPLPARHSAQIDPEYRQVVCPDCKGKGTIALSSADRANVGGEK